MSDTPQERARRRREIRTQAINALGNGVCAHCGCNDIRVLQIDHIYNNGAEERRSGIKQMKLYRKFINFPFAYRASYQILCANCHTIKTWHTEEEETDQ